MNSDPEILKICKIWDDYIGFNFIVDIDLNEVREPLQKALNSNKLITYDQLNKYNQYVIFDTLRKRKTENPELNRMITAVRMGKTEKYYTYGYDNNEQLVKLIKDSCERLGLLSQE